MKSKKKVGYSTFATFEKPPRKRNFKFINKIFLRGGFFILVFGGAVYLLIFSPVFKVKTIEISGNKEAASVDIRAIAQEFLAAKKFKFLPQDSLIFLSPDSLKNKIQQKDAVIAAISIKKIFPDKLAIDIVERKTAAVWCETKTEEIALASSTPAAASLGKTALTPSPGAAMKKNLLPEANGCFFIDEAGVIFRGAPEIFGSLMPILYNKTSRAYKLGEEVVASSTMTFAVDIKREFRRIGVSVAGFLLDDKTVADSDLSALTDEGWLIYFNIARPPAYQAQAVGVLLNGELKEKRKNLEYIDLRIDNRVYYK